MFHVGQKVVCLKEGPWVATYGGPCPAGSFPVNGEVVTIREIVRHDGRGFLRFHEHRNPVHWGGPETAFAAERFRPIIERKTDISCFVRILDKVNSKQPAKV
jgi:hypothetical protein